MARRISFPLFLAACAIGAVIALRVVGHGIKPAVPKREPVVPSTLLKQPAPSDIVNERFEPLPPGQTFQERLPSVILAPPKPIIAAEPPKREARHKRSRTRHRRTRIEVVRPY